jgi:hypothetical protein
MRSVTAVAITIAVLALPAVASAAQIQVDRPCYADPSQREDTVTLSGSGFTPNAVYQVTLDGQPLPGGSGQADAQGGVRGTFRAPALATLSAARRRHTFTLGVQEGVNAPTTTFTVSKLVADFRPSGGDPRTLRVRFSVFGFGLQAAPGDPPPVVYLHYIRPNGKPGRTVQIGAATGPCGSISRTARRRLFPFKAERGSWRLQFDTNAAFKKGNARSPFLFYTVGVRVGSAVT